MHDDIRQSDPSRSDQSPHAWDQEGRTRHIDLFLAELYIFVERYDIAVPSVVCNVNAAARLIYNLKRSDHITDALVSLHWLRVPEHIQSINQSNQKGLE